VKRNERGGVSKKGRTLGGRRSIRDCRMERMELFRSETSEPFSYNGEGFASHDQVFSAKEFLMFAMLACLALAADPTDWEKAEAVHLKSIRQLTFDFVRAGEGYFSPDAKQIIFQAEEKDTGNPFYQIFVQDLASGKYRRVSPGVGKTTCSYFSPDGKKIIFASSHLDPDAKKHY